MQNTRNAPSVSNKPQTTRHPHTTSSPTQLEVATSTLQQLQAAIQTANTTKTSLITQLHTLRQSVQSSFDSLTTEQATQTKGVERAARSLAVRAMELDNRALQIDHHESALQSARSQFDEHQAVREGALEERSRRLTQRETAVLAREASLKYSAVEQMRLHAWSRELEKREARLGEAEDAEKERIAARITAVARRELLVVEKETRVDTMIKQREADLLKREKAADAVAHTLERQRSEALLQIEAERSQFWAHQQKLSAVVAAETEALLAEQANLRKQFEQDARTAKLTVKHMMEQVAKATKLFESASAVRANGGPGLDVGEPPLTTTKLATLHVKGNERIEHVIALENEEMEENSS